MVDQDKVKLVILIPATVNVNVDPTTLISTGLPVPLVNPSVSVIYYKHHEGTFDH